MVQATLRVGGTGCREARPHQNPCVVDMCIALVKFSDICEANFYRDYLAYPYIRGVDLGLLEISELFRNLVHVLMHAMMYLQQRNEQG